LVATWTQADAERTGVPAGTYIVDYKSSSDPKKWALSEAELQRDLAACIYRVAGRQLRDPTLLWLYTKSRGTPTVYPQRATLKYLPALARVRAVSRARDRGHLRVDRGAWRAPRVISWYDLR
jgi:hypothetical protein